MRVKDWRYCLVKWQGSEYDQVTWERVTALTQIYGPSIEKVFVEF